MRKTKVEATNNNIAVDLRTLQNMTCLGRQSCEKIAKEAGAIRKIGRRRLFLVDKIRIYLENAEGGDSNGN